VTLGSFRVKVGIVGMLSLTVVGTYINRQHRNIKLRQQPSRRVVNCESERRTSVIPIACYDPTSPTSMPSWIITGPQLRATYPRQRNSGRRIGADFVAVGIT